MIYELSKYFDGPVRAAVFKDEKYGGVFAVCVPAVASPDDDRFLDHVRVSQWSTVTFRQRPPAEIIPAQLAKLAEFERAVRREYDNKLLDIERRRGELLALPAPEKA